MATQLKTTRVELNNAVFSLPDIVAKAEGYFEQEGLDVHLVLPEKRKQMIAAAGAPVQQHTAVQSFLWHEGIEKGEFSVYHASDAALGDCARRRYRPARSRPRSAWLSRSLAGYIAHVY